MKAGTMLTEFEARAADALKALFERISAIRLIDLKHVSQPGGIILARVEILGHSHTLVCGTRQEVEPANLREVLRELEIDSASAVADAIPVLIAPYLAPEAQELCKQTKTGFLDFEGNARLTVGDFFIVMRSLPRQAAKRASAAPRKLLTRSAADLIFPNAVAVAANKQAVAGLSA